jgi:hypothetical protein
MRYIHVCGVRGLCVVCVVLWFGSKNEAEELLRSFHHEKDRAKTT